MTNTKATGASLSEGKSVPWAALTALGVVFGDLGTSPLYTLQTIVQAMGGRFTSESALGILSLIVWTLVIIISVDECSAQQPHAGQYFDARRKAVCTNQRH